MHPVGRVPGRRRGAPAPGRRRLAGRRTWPGPRRPGGRRGEPCRRSACRARIASASFHRPRRIRPSAATVSVKPPRLRSRPARWPSATASSATLMASWVLPALSSTTLYRNAAEAAGVGGRCGEERLSAQLDTGVRVAEVVAHRTLDVPGHDPRERIGLEVGRELDRLARQPVRRFVPAGHELGLAETGEHAGGLRPVVTGEQRRRPLELGLALLEAPGGPQVAAEALVTPRLALRRRSRSRRRSGQLDRSVAADRGLGKLGGLPHPVAATFAGGVLADASHSSSARSRWRNAAPGATDSAASAAASSATNAALRRRRGPGGRRARSPGPLEPEVRLGPPGSRRRCGGADELAAGAAGRRRRPRRSARGGTGTPRRRPRAAARRWRPAPPCSTASSPRSATRTSSSMARLVSDRGDGVEHLRASVRRAPRCPRR